MLVLNSLRRAWVPLVIVGIVMASVPAIIGQAAYTAPSHTFSIPTGSNHDAYVWQGTTLQSPDSASGVLDPTGGTCDAVEGNCEEILLTVPDDAPAPRTLYLKIAWQHPVWKAYMYVIAPDQSIKGTQGLGCDGSVFDKGCGNETSLPLDELTIDNPDAGVWKVRVVAVNIHNEDYKGMASLVAGNRVEYAKENLAQLTGHLTRDQRINLVFTGWTPTEAELNDIKGALPDEYVPSTAQKQNPDGSDDRDDGGQVSGLVQHNPAHFSGTDPNNSHDTGTATPRVPYFQPLKFKPDYHFLVADDLYTRDLYSAMRDATRQDQVLATTSVYATSLSGLPSYEGAYLAKYNAQFGQFRGGKAADCSDPSCPVDLIDAFTVEDWIQSTRLDPKYCNSFTDMDTGATTGAQFINPDPNAVRDPYWDGNGSHAVNVDSQPQGTSQGLTFMLMDTFYPAYADEFFRPNRYHMFATFDHIKDPDTGAGDQVDNTRGWGGRYRFYFQDLGAAPTFYERENWLREEVAATDGSAGFDPPIWQYRNDPTWNGVSPPSQADSLLRAGGSVFGGVLGWDVNQGLAFKYIGSYLYRPVPNDFYILATNNWIDHYSDPDNQPGAFYKVDFSKVYKPELGIKALNSASPYASFADVLPGYDFAQAPLLGCATNRESLQLDTITGFPVSKGPGVDPNCNTGIEDPRQHALEQGKANGALDTGIPDAGVNSTDLRNFVDHNRDSYAPLRDGAFTVPVLNVYFEKVYNVALPLIVGGLAEGTNDGEGWGQIDNLNERSISKTAILCDQSPPFAPACLPGGGPFTNARALTYIVQHEAAHFQGLHHPHDGTQSVERAEGQPPPGSPFTGAWHYYYSMNKWQYDLTASPTTYGHTYGIYEVVDQDRLMYGHTSEYIKQAQDWVADAYFTDGANGESGPTALTSTRETTMKQYRDYSSDLFQRGDYLHSQFAMRDAMLYAKGFFFPQVEPHRMSLEDAGRAAAPPLCIGDAIGCSDSIEDGNAVFAIHPQPVYSSDVCGAGTTTPGPVVPDVSLGTPNTSASAWPHMFDNSRAPLLLVAPVVFVAALAALSYRAVRRRWNAG
ncbi:MAG: hypothetical protein QOE92_2279 [Chloroflexota bacterium]|nr:hypothetical protein [Chloroflexota bacterium]